MNTKALDVLSETGMDQAQNLSVRVESGHPAPVRISSTRELTLMGLLVAIVFVMTYYIQITLPIAVNGGLIHMGNVALFTVAIVLGKKRGAAAGAFGMGLFDLLSGWIAWAPYTFVIRGIMGYLIGRVADHNGAGGKNMLLNTAALFIGAVWMILGYYGAEGVMYGNWLAPATSIPGNLIQLVIGAVVALPLSKMLLRVQKTFGRN